LVVEGDLSIKIIEGAHQFIEEEIAQSVERRQRWWNRDFTSRESYERSVDPNRKRFMKIIGVVDKTEPLQQFATGIRDQHPGIIMERYALDADALVVGETSRFIIYQVRWPVLNKIYGEGLLLEPKTKPVGNIIAIPDADQTPEQLVGLSPGIPLESQFARRLAENGFKVLVPMIISRQFLFTGMMHQQTHREWLYRQAYHMGKHVIGFEVQKILSAVDWFEKSSPAKTKVGVAGYHEGGLLAFYAAAVDRRIEATLVSGYFNARESTWNEPLYRNVWGLLSEFGDAEIASLIAPRSIVIEHSTIPELIEQVIKPGEAERKIGAWPFTGYKGTLRTPDYKTLEAEFIRIGKIIPKNDFQQRHVISGPNKKATNFGSDEALQKFCQLLGLAAPLVKVNEMPEDRRSAFKSEERQVRQVQEIEHHVQGLLRDSDQARNQFFLYRVMPEFEKRSWSTKPVHPSYPPARFIDESKKYQKIFREEILGQFSQPMLSPQPRSRKLYDNARWTGYEVVLDVFRNLSAAGVLLIPKDIRPGERRPVVVCQHGRDDIPQKLVEGNNSAYNDVASKLADKGFIVYAPYNPYRGEDLYRWLDRKANTVKATLFSFILAQHDQTLRWLGGLPFVDNQRIAFYGLSYGGETAMRIPAALDGYCLSICAGDFGDWTRKVVDTHFKGSFMNTLEWEMPYFDMGSTFSYAEMAYLIFPRPFMVERGHDDLVQPTEWVAYEYGKVKYFYDQFGLADKTAIEFFNGGHSMRGEGTFDFLHKHLNWPQNK
jgi:dienelactone hydrolase